MIGIYCITNKTNGKRYIGQSWDIHARILRHKKELKENKHTNMHLQSAWNKYGDVFEFSEMIILEDNENTQILLDILEDYYINTMNLLNNKYGYNKRGGGSHGKMSEELKKKMSESCKLKPINWLAIQKMKEANIGNPVSEETKKRLSLALTGKPKSEAHRKAMSNRKLKLESIGKRTATRKALGHYEWSKESIAKREATKKKMRELRNIEKQKEIA